MQFNEQIFRVETEIQISLQIHWIWVSKVDCKILNCYLKVTSWKHYLTWILWIEYTEYHTFIASHFQKTLKWNSDQQQMLVIYKLSTLIVICMTNKIIELSWKASSIRQIVIRPSAVAAKDFNWKQLYSRNLINFRIVTCAKSFVAENLIKFCFV